MTTETRPVQIKPNIFDIFIGGARKGWTATWEGSSLYYIKFSFTNGILPYTI